MDLDFLSYKFMKELGVHAKHTTIRIEMGPKSYAATLLTVGVEADDDAYTFSYQATVNAPSFEIVRINEPR